MGIFGKKRNTGVWSDKLGKGALKPTRRQRKINAAKKTAARAIRDTPAKQKTFKITRKSAQSTKAFAKSGQGQKSGGKGFAPLPPKTPFMKTTGTTPPRFSRFRGVSTTGKTRLVKGPTGLSLLRKNVLTLTRAQQSIFLTQSKKGLPLALHTRRGAPALPRSQGALIQKTFSIFNLAPRPVRRLMRFSVPLKIPFRMPVIPHIGVGSAIGGVSNFFSGAAFFEAAFVDIDTDVDLGLSLGLLQWSLETQAEAIALQVSVDGPSEEGEPPHSHAGPRRGLKDVQIVITESGSGQTFALVGVPKKSGVRFAPRVSANPNNVRLDGQLFQKVGVPVPQAMEHGANRVFTFPINNPESWRGPVVMLNGRPHAVVRSRVKARPFMRPALTKTLRRGKHIVAASVAAQL